MKHGNPYVEGQFFLTLKFMRFQIALNLQKQQVEQEYLLDQQAAALKPIRDFITKEYSVTKVWVDPISQSIGRITNNLNNARNTNQ